MDGFHGLPTNNHSSDSGDLGTAAGRPNVWSLVKDHLDTMVTQAFQRGQLDRLYSNRLVDTLSHLRRRLESLLHQPLKRVVPGHMEGQTIHQKVEHAVEDAMDETLHEFNMTETLAANTSLVSVRERLVMTLDSEIELDVFNQVFTNGTDGVERSSRVLHSLHTTVCTPQFAHHSLHTTDETMFVVLVCMAIIIPAIFISLLLIVFYYKRQSEARERRQEMLLQDQPEFSLDEYNMEDRQLSLKIEIPDLDLHHLKI